MSAMAYGPFTPKNNTEYIAPPCCRTLLSVTRDTEERSGGRSEGLVRACRPRLRLLGGYGDGRINDAGIM